MFKVAFNLKEERPGWPPVAVERLWGEKTGVKFEVRVVNTPFFARGIAFGDLIQVRPDNARRELVFEAFTAESGHSTVRIVVIDSAHRDEVESELRNAGCTWEGSGQFTSLLAVDIPPVVDYGLLRQWLRSRIDDGFIEIQESAISTNHRAQVTDFP